MGLRPIIPKPNNFSDAKFRTEVNKAIDKTMNVGVGLFNRTTKGWNTSVEFFVVHAVDMKGAVGTDNLIYSYVSRGTRPHLITPVRGSYLVWEAGKYSAKTRVGVLGSRGTGTGLKPSGGVGKPVFAKKVHHPGTKARGFEENIAAKLQPILTVNVTAALLKVSM